jgi:hypothetical protein
MTQFKSGDNVDDNILGQNETINVDDDVIISFVYYDWALSREYLVKGFDLVVRKRFDSKSNLINTIKLLSITK